MDITIKNFLTIMKAALTGEQLDPGLEIPPEQMQKLLTLAGIHNVMVMFVDAVYAAPALRPVIMPFQPALRPQIMRQVTEQTVRTEQFLALNRHLQAGGIRPLVVKGSICRMLYPNPAYRHSGDEDVLIPPEQFDECHRLMLEFGMEAAMPGELQSNAYEVPYCKAGSPLYIELHKHLFSPESEAYGDLNRFFEGVFDSAIPEQIGGNTVYTLAYTDHLFYLICHAFKHFLHSGFGIRQVCDIILYANAYGSRIDWMRILENCRRIRADKFAAALFQIGSNYLVFDPEKAAYPRAWREIRVDEIPMLEDLLAGGIYGAADMSRKHSSSITLDAVTAQKQGRKTHNAVLTSLFPPVCDLVGRYPYLQKHPWLLPAAWISRLWNYFRETRQTSDSNAADALKIGSERVELMKEYGILK